MREDYSFALELPNFIPALEAFFGFLVVGQDLMASGTGMNGRDGRHCG